MGKLLIIPLALLGLLVGSLVWSGGGTHKRADLVYIDRADVITLDPNLMSYLQDFRISYAFREGLVAYAPGTLEPKPAGAERVDVSDDKRVWTFHLRPAAKWSDGSPVTTKDYVFAWRRMLEEPGDYTYLFFYIHNAEAYSKAFTDGTPMSWDEVGIKAPDERTLVVTLDNPVTYFLDIVAFVPYYPLNEKSMEPFKQVDPKTHRVHYRPDFTRPPYVVSNGPFELKTWEFKRRLYLEKSPTYWDKDNVKFNSLECMINEDRLSQVLSYESGAVDWVADVGNDIAAELKANGRPDLSLTPGFGTIYLSVNTAPKVSVIAGKNPLNDMRVRQAIAMAIDRKQICDNTLRMGELPASTFIPPGIFPGYHTNPGFVFDPAKAKQLLAEAGYPDGRGLPPIPLMFRVESPVLRDMVQSIKNQLRANLNIDVELVGLESKICKARYSEKSYAIGVSSWIGDYGDPSTFTDKYLSASLNNDSNWGPKEYDDFCAQATREPDPDKRLRLLEEAERILNTELPIIPVYHVVNMDWCRPYVKIKFNPRMTTVWKGIEIDRGAK